MRKMFIILIFVSLFSSICFGANQDSVLNKKIEDFEVNNMTVADAIAELAVKCELLGILITFEEPISSDKEVEISLKESNASVHGILNKLINKDKSYSWENQGNIVSIIPSNKKNDRFTSIIWKTLR